MNNVNLIGRLTKDIDLRYGESGKAFGMFALAVQRSYKNRNGEYEADFINCRVFGKTAEIMTEHIHKGQQVGIRGNIQVDKYQKNGEQVYATNVIVQEFTFVGNNNSGQGGNAQRPPQRQNNAHTGNSASGGNDFNSNNVPMYDGIDISDDDLPF